MKEQIMPSLPDVDSLISELARRIGAVTENTALVGIHTGGVWVAERLHTALGIEHPLGTLAVTLHRDDFEKIGLHAQTRATHIPFDVEGRHIILIDDVLYTGRTIRAALNELFDFGRPTTVKLACLVDRDGRELPIAADYCGTQITLPASQELVLDKQGETLKLRVQERT